MPISPQTIHDASQALNALQTNGIQVKNVVFDPESDSYAIELESGLVGPNGIGGGTIKGVGGGTIKDA